MMIVFPSKKVALQQPFNTIIKNRSLRYIVTYTFFFLLLACVVFFPFFRDKKGFVWSNDGLRQSYSTMAYLGTFYRTIINNFLHFKFEIPQVDFKVGLGYDILTTLNYYGLGDPLLLFTVFFRKEKTELLYNFIVIFRYYLSGLSFSYYCFHMNKKGYPTLVGALSYSFCGFALFAGVRFPYFINSMIYLPLLLVGAEKIFRKKSSLFFSIFVAVSAVSNYYFFYMITLLLFLYIVIRYFDIYRKNWLSNLLINIRNFFLAYVAGIGLAAFALVPAMIAFMGNGRKVSITEKVDLLYDVNFRWKFIYSFFSANENMGRFTAVSFSSLCVVSVLVLYLKKRKRWDYISLKISFLLCTFMMLSPIPGKILSGFSHPENRWMFGYAFLVCFILVCVFDDLMSLSVLQSILFLLLFVFLYINGKIYHIGVRAYAIGCFEMIIVIVALCMLSRIRQKAMHKKLILFALLLVSIAIKGYILYSEKGLNYVSEFHGTNLAYQDELDTPEVAMGEIQDTDFYRISNNAIDGDRPSFNMSLITGYPDTNAYYSLMPNNVSDYFASLELSSLRLIHRYLGFDGITRVEALASTKYYATTNGANDYVPYGYVNILNKTRNDNAKITDSIYQNTNQLPLGYTYTSCIKKSIFDQLTGVEKQQALLQAVLLDDNAIDFFDKNISIPTDPSIQYEQRPLSYEIVSSPDIILDEGNHTLQVKKQNAKMTLRVDAKKGEELYLRLKGLDITSAYEDYFIVKLSCNDVKKECYVFSDNYRWGKKRRNYLINFGNKQDGTVEIKLNFPRKGVFSLDEIEMYSLPFQYYDSQIHALKQNTLENVSFDTNRIAGTISVDQDKVLALSIPYSKGWTAYVDGKKVKLLQANIMYMAIPISKGNHTVKLVYSTPGLKQASIISLLTLVIIIVLFYWKKCRYRKRIGTS